jgi:ribosomal protein S18 acetylase RimI-like enzyme
MIFKTNVATIDDIHEHLVKCTDDFVFNREILSKQYADKLHQYATIFEAWDKDILIGFIAIYLNDSEKHHGYITMVSVLPEYRKQGIAKMLLKTCIAHAKTVISGCITLEINPMSKDAHILYKKFGFETISTILELKL